MADLLPFVEAARQKKMEDATIRDYLAKKGHSPEEIDGAFSKLNVGASPDIGNTRITPSPQMQQELKQQPQYPQVRPNTPAMFGQDMATGGEQHQRDMLGKAVEYGVPAMVGLATGGMGALPAQAALSLPRALLMQVGANAAVTGASTLAGSMIRGRDPLAESFKQAAEATLADIVLSVGLPYIGRKVLSGVMMKGGKGAALTEGAEAARDVLAQRGKALSPSQMTGKVSGIGEAAEGFVRGSFFGAGPFKKGDAGRGEALESVYRELMNQLGDSTDRVRFGEVLRSILVGEVDPLTGKIVQGGVDAFIDGSKKSLYAASDALIDGKGITVPIDAFDDLLAQAEKFADTPEIGPAVKILQKYRPKEEVAAAGAIVHPTTGLPMQAGGVVPPTDIPLEDAIMAHRLINQGIKKAGGNEGVFKGLRGTNSRLQPLIEDAIAQGAGPDALDAWKTAEAFNAEKSELMKQAFVKAVKRKLVSNPSAVMEMLEGGGRANDALNQLERLWKYAETGGGGKVAGMQGLPDFEEAVLRPIRFDLLNRAFTPDGKLVAEGIQKYATGRFSPAALERIFGSGAPETIRKMDLAAQHLADKNYSERIIPKLVESGMAGSAVLGMATAEGSGVSVKAMKALGLMAVWNNGLARMMNNPKTLNRVLDGAIAGPTDSRFAQSVYNVLAVGASDLEKMRRQSAERWKAFTADGVLEREKERAANEAREQTFSAGMQMMDALGSAGVGP